MGELDFADLIPSAGEKVGSQASQPSQSHAEDQPAASPQAEPTAGGAKQYSPEVQSLGQQFMAFLHGVSGMGQKSPSSPQYDAAAHPDKLEARSPASETGDIHIPLDQQTTLAARLDQGKAPPDDAPQGETPNVMQSFTQSVAGVPAAFVRAIQRLEGLDKKPRWDVKQWTVGWGTRASGPDERPSLQDLSQRFADEITQAAHAVDKVNPHLDAGTRAALTSLTFNVGPGWSNGRLGAIVRSGDVEGIKRMMQAYTLVSGAPNKIIGDRRREEGSWIGQQDINEPVKTWRMTPPASIPSTPVRTASGEPMRAAPTRQPGRSGSPVPSDRFGIGGS